MEIVNARMSVVKNIEEVFKMAVKNAMTSDFLHSAYGGESMAHMRYLIWADVADKEGFPNVGRLFREIGRAHV